VAAKDKATNKEQSIRITSSSGLNKEEIDKMKSDAQSHSAEDKKRKEEIETKNQADNLVFQTRKQLKDLADKMPADVKSQVETAVNALEEAVKGGNHNDIKAKMESLNNAWNDASTKMYEAAKGQQAGGPGPGQPGPEQQQQQQPTGDKGKKVEDADYEVVDDK
jgi:molecular chaperone DnaK